MASLKRSLVVNALMDRSGQQAGAPVSSPWAGLANVGGQMLGAYSANRLAQKWGQPPGQPPGPSNASQLPVWAAGGVR